MASYLGFDTIVVDTGVYDNDSLFKLFSFFEPYGIKNFIFLSDFDLAIDSFSLEKIKINNFRERLASVCPRLTHGKVFYKLFLDSGAAFNADFKRLYAVKTRYSVFCSLPLMLESNYDNISKDMNKILYRHKAFPIFANFDTVLNTSDHDFCCKLLRDIKAGFCLDINFMFDKANFPIMNKVLEYNTYILPKVSRELLEYENLDEMFGKFMVNIGKQNYYNKICHCMTKCAAKINC